MKIISVETSKVFGYYVSGENRDIFSKKCEYGVCRLLEKGDERQLYVTIDYDPSTYALLKMYMSRIQKITVGSLYLYEYELGVTSTIGDKNFIIDLGDMSYCCKMQNVYTENPDYIVIVFDII